MEERVVVIQDQTKRSTGSERGSERISGSEPSNIVKLLVEKRNVFHYISEDQRFQFGALLIITLNAIWLGLGVDMDYSGSSIPHVIFLVGDSFFAACFSLELLVRFVACKRWYHFFTDKERRWWNMFDLILVLLMVVETWLFPLLGFQANIKSLSSLRLLRLLRISRLFRMVPELGMMVKSMAAAARSVSSTLILELAVMYVFAIIFTQWAKTSQHRLEKTPYMEDPGFFNEYFGSILKSMMTLLQLLVYDSALQVIRTSMHETYMIGWALVLFIITGSFMVLNILIGVIAEIVASTTEEEEDKLMIEAISRVFDTIDVDMSGSVSRDEYDKSAKPLLQKLGIDDLILENAFAIIDIDESGQLEKGEFVTMLSKMLHDPAVEDLLLILNKLDIMCGDFNKKLHETQDELELAVQEQLHEFFFSAEYRWMEDEEFGRPNPNASLIPDEREYFYSSSSDEDDDMGLGI